MENTSDKSFVSHNSDKPFIRTMEDDLKKIKNNPTGKAGVASAVFSLASKPSEQKFFQNKAEQRPIVAPSRPSTPAPTPSVPKNLQVNMPLAEKEEIGDAPVKSIFKPIEKPKPKISTVYNEPVDQVKEKINSAGSGFAREKKSNLSGSLSKLAFDPTRDLSRRKSVEVGPVKQKEKNIPVFKPIASVSENSFLGKAQGGGKLTEDIENLPPEARLARQLSLGANSDSEYKESLIMPPTVRVSRPISEQSVKFAQPLSSPSPSISSFENRKRSIEEIIKEDNKSSSFFGKFIKALIAVLFIAGIGASAYYFFILKKSVNVQPPISIESFVFGARDVDIKMDVNADLKNEVNKYFLDGMPSGMYRLILKDIDGKNILDLQNFRKSSNIFLPDYVANVLEKDYNLIAFNYPEKNYLRLGLVLKPKKTIDISVIAREWETGMYENIEAMFMGDLAVYDHQKKFGGNKYNNFDIRYLPLGSENAALNYAVDSEKKFLIVATSKQDIYSLIDNIIKGK